MGRNTSTNMSSEFVKLFRKGCSRFSSIQVWRAIRHVPVQEPLLRLDHDDPFEHQFHQYARVASV